MKLQTQVAQTDFNCNFSLSDRIMVLGSCFADNIGAKLIAAGFDVCVNPFGTLYNPASICSAAARLDSAEPFTEDDCVQMGAGSDLICSFSHHTSFARPTKEEFLSHANESLRQAAEFWRGCNKLLVTLGTAMVWRHDGNVVSNCLKRPGTEFTHEMLELDEAATCLQCLVSYGKDCTFTISPIRHLSEGAHQNNLSKALLHLALTTVEDAGYFPAYEILLDELRDYRFYSDDLCHPSSLAVNYIWERFLETAVPAEELPKIKENEKAARFTAHRSFR